MDKLEIYKRKSGKQTAKIRALLGLEQKKTGLKDYPCINGSDFFFFFFFGCVGSSFLWEGFL